MNVLAGKNAWRVAPMFFLAGCLALFIVWGVLDPATLTRLFDQEGHSPIELLTLPFFAAIVPLVWWKCPFTGSVGRKVLLSAAVSVVATMAVVKELDLHLAFITALYPDVVAHFKGTPFKMRFLTRASIPFGAKLVSLSYFVLFFGVFAAVLTYFARRLIIGIFRFHPVAWTMGCFGACGVMVQIFDRLPAWWRHAHDLPRDGVTAFTSLCTTFEEGGEMMLALFGLLAVFQGYLIYSAKAGESEFKDL